MGGPWPQLAGSISQLALLASAKGWVCPAWPMSLSFFRAVRRAAGPWGRWEAPACLAGPRGQGLRGQQEAPPKDSDLTLASSHPGNCLNSGATTPFLAVTLFPQRCPPPERGGSTLCCRFWGQEASTSGT